MKENRLKVFISYSWDNEEHKEWVLGLANNLIEIYGLDVLLDRYELVVGSSMTSFMERSLEAADKVLIVLTPDYKTKAMNRKGGAGFEHSIITQALYELQDRNDKYLPILRSGSKDLSAPGYVSTLMYHPMSNDNQYETDLDTLARTIYGKPKTVKPALGSIPNFDELPLFDVIIERAEKLKGREDKERERIIFIDGEPGLQLVRKEVYELIELIKLRAKTYQEKTHLHFSTEEDRDRVILCGSEGFSILVSFRQEYSNSARGAKLHVSYYGNNCPTFDRGAYWFDGDEPKILSEKVYRFDIDENYKPLWKDSLNSVGSSTQEMVKEFLLWIIDKVEAEKDKKSKESRKRDW